MYDTDIVLNSISSLTSNLSLDEMLADFIEKIVELLQVDGGTIFQFRHSSNTLEVLVDYVTPRTNTPFDDTSHIGAVYPLAHYPALAQSLQQQTSLTIYVDKSTENEAEEALLTALQWHGLLAIPMVCKNKTMGVLNLYLSEENEHQFSDEIVHLAQILANHVALAMENADLHLGAYEGQLVSEAMQVIGRTLASDLDYQRVVRSVAEFAYQLVNAQFVYVAVPDDEKFRLVATAGHDLDAPIPIPGVNGSITLEHPSLIQAVQEKRPVVVDDVQNGTPSRPDILDDLSWRSMVAVPLLANNRLVGVLAAYSHQPDFFSANDVAYLMSLASQAAITIQNAQLFAELEAQRETLHQVSLRLVNAQEDERRRISRELHDELGQALTALKINLDVARRSLPSDAPEKLQQSVSEASKLAVETLESARNLSLELHPAILDDLGLVSALRWEIDRFEQRTSQPVQFRSDLADTTLRPEVEITIYRIVTEALTNVARHAQANTISVRLQVQNHQVSIYIEDDGVGFDAQGWFNSPAERRSLGLVSMRERAGLLGGELDVISELECGTTVRVQIPLENMRIKEK